MNNITNKDTKNTLTTFNWGDLALKESVLIENVPHFTRVAIGEFLEYADPQNAIDKILERNIEIERYTLPVRLSGKTGQKFDTKVYHPIGFLLIVMASEQPKAKAMKVAVAEFVYYFGGSKELTLKEEMELNKLKRTLLNDIAKTKDMFAREGLIDGLNQVCSRLRQNMPDINNIGKDANQLSLGV